jgi:hypothetical protein
MKFETTTGRIPQLVTWAKNHQLAVLTGAGVSMLSPSSLPSWWRLNIDTYRKFAGDDPELRGFADAIEQMPLPPSVLAQFLWEILGSDEYPNSLGVLRSGVPNQNHHVLAALAARDCLTDIVTLNFDRLHERALASAGVAYTVNVSSQAEPLHPSKKDTLGVWKLHGTIDRPETILATLDQTTREQGIGPEKKASLREVRARANLPGAGILRRRLLPRPGLPRLDLTVMSGHADLKHASWRDCCRRSSACANEPRKAGDHHL